ncbi:hypothetical protein [Nocardia altamirensis]|uniref:hypothetical protein n=1 Tax=Nocardia altamirensis TaxID=472158 RepID=UPI00083FDDE1|nr:hypothetical protein [Nocardia altamirensis]
MWTSARELWRNPVLRTAYILQVTAVVALAASWQACYAGLTSRSTRDPQFELDAGGSFAVAFAVYLPFFVLVTPCLVIVAISGLTSYRFAPSATAFGAVIMGAFAHWARINDALIDNKPALSGFLDASNVLAGLAGVAALAAIAVRFRTVRRATILASVLVVLAAYSITSAGWIGKRVLAPQCGERLSDWFDADATSIYAGTATYTAPPFENPGTRHLDVVLEFHAGNGRATTKPETPVSMTQETSAELTLSSYGGFVKLDWSVGYNSRITRLESPVCAPGSTTVTSAAYYGHYSTFIRRDTATYRATGTLTRTH